ncbi:MAG: hypothetical protein ABGW86_00635 [Candidatus Poseidoniia archaeon]|jgi:hypothetical protein
MYSLRNSLILVIAICAFLPLSQAEDNVYRVEGIPDDLHYETAKVYLIDLTANNYSAIASVTITISNGTLSETEEFTPDVQSLELDSSDVGWTFYWEAPSESFELGDGEAILSIVFKEEDGSVWSSFDSVLRPPEIHEEDESVVPEWALSLAWTGVSITVLLTIIGAFVLRRDRLT